MNKGRESCDIGRIEDNHHKLGVRAVLLDVVAEFCGNLAVALEEVLTGHAFLTGCAAAGDDVFCILEGLCGINCGSEVHALKCAVVHFCQDTLETGLKDIVEADV